MNRVYLVTDSAEITRRRSLVPPGELVEAWPDVHAGGHVWIGPDTKTRLEQVAGPLATALSVDADRVAIYYGPRLDELASLPTEESLRARVLSAHGVAVAWITLDQFGSRNSHAPQSPLDPVFFLRRPGSTVAHLWRLFRTKEEAIAYMREFYGTDPEARGWAEELAVGGFPELLERHARPEQRPP